MKRKETLILVINDVREVKITLERILDVSELADSVIDTLSEIIEEMAFSKDPLDMN